MANRESLTNRKELIMDMIDELVWEHNRKWVLEGLQALETCPVESYATHIVISDYRA